MLRESLLVFNQEEIFISSELVDLKIGEVIVRNQEVSVIGMNKIRKQFTWN